MKGKQNPNYGNRWTDAQKEALSEKMIGRYADEKNPRATRIKCVETGEVFDCIKKAQEHYDVKW